MKTNNSGDYNKSNKNNEEDPALERFPEENKVFKNEGSIQRNKENEEKVADKNILEDILKNSVGKEDVGIFETVAVKEDKLSKEDSLKERHALHEDPNMTKNKEEVTISVKESKDGENIVQKNMYSSPNRPNENDTSEVNEKITKYPQDKPVLYTVNKVDEENKNTKLEEERTDGEKAPKINETFQEVIEVLTDNEEIAILSKGKEDKNSTQNYQDNSQEVNKETIGTNDTEAEETKLEDQENLTTLTEDKTVVTEKTVAIMDQFIKLEEEISDNDNLKDEQNAISVTEEKSTDLEQTNEEIILHDDKNGNKALGKAAKGTDIAEEKRTQPENNSILEKDSKENQISEENLQEPAELAEIEEKVEIEVSEELTTTHIIASNLVDSPSEYFFCGAFGGLLSVLVGHPFDTVKVLMQTATYNISVRDAMSLIISCEGFTGFYKGVSVPLITAVPIFAGSFMTYKMGKMFLESENKIFTFKDYFIAGAFSGFICSFVVAPFERIKSVLQTQQSFVHYYKGPIDVGFKLYRRGGVKSLFRGLGLTLLRDVPGAGVYFATYERFKDLLTDHGNKPLTLPITILAGGTAGLPYCITMPVDVLKSRLQTAHEGAYPGGYKQVLTTLVKKEGLKGVYRGVVPLLLRSFPANAACFAGFEMWREIIRDAAEAAAAFGY